MERDCNNCIRCTPDEGCTSWDCDYINRKEAIKAWKQVSNAKEVKYYDEDEKVWKIGRVIVEQTERSE